LGGPDKDHLYSLLADAAEKATDNALLLSVRQEIVSSKPNDSFSHFQLGLAYLKVGNRAAALTEYGFLKNRDPKRARQLFGRKRR